MNVEDYLSGDYFEEPSNPDEPEHQQWGCLYPESCVMVGEHLSHECMTAQEMSDYYGTQESLVDQERDSQRVTPPNRKIFYIASSIKNVDQVKKFQQEGGRDRE